MLNYIEKNPLPEICQSCNELDCYNCEHAGERLILPERDKIKKQLEKLELTEQSEEYFLL